MTRPPPALREGSHSYCRACGHDLPGLSGRRCPACGRLPGQSAGRGASGRWVVAGVLLTGVALAVVGLKFRRFEPLPSPTTRPATQPDRPQSP